MIEFVSPQIVGRYGIYGKIASGGMASVHFGRLLGAVGFSRTVAIKRLHPHLAEDPDFLATMIDEARLAARIHHPNVVPTLDVVAADGELLVVMEYVRGESLARLLRGEAARGGRIPLPVASAIVIGALHGLHAAHEATSDQGQPLDIVHRDVSPQNILVGRDGLARVIDFGVARAAGRLQTTREGVVKGKVAYMAPEQLTAADATRAVDVYGMGVVLWEILAGRRLFRGDSEGAVLGQVSSGSKEPPSHHAPGLPEGLDDLVMKALATDPAARFATALEMAEALLRLVPPAFPTTVGEWVEEVAHDALAQRGAALAEIESSSGIPNAASVVGASRSTTGGDRTGARRLSDVNAADDALTIASQPSNVAVVTSRAPGARRGWMLGAALAGIAVVVVVAVLAWRGGAASNRAAAAEVAPTAASAPPESPTAAPAAAPPATETVPTVDLSSLPPVAEPPVSAKPAQKAGPAPRSRTHGANCDPPYYFDSSGIKHYKRECN